MLLTPRFSFFGKNPRWLILEGLPGSLSYVFRMCGSLTETVKQRRLGIKMKAQDSLCNSLFRGIGTESFVNKCV